MELYKSILDWEKSFIGIPAAAVRKENSVIMKVCQSMISAFGLPSVVDFQRVYEIIKTNVWDYDLGNGIVAMFAEGIAAAGKVGSLAIMSMVSLDPLGPLSIPFVIPATTRLFLVLACDLILILCKCFEARRHTSGGQPDYRELEHHAREYRWHGLSREVRIRIKSLLPRRNVIECYRTGKVRNGIQQIIEEVRDRIRRNQDNFTGIRELAHSQMQIHGTEPDQELFDDIRDATAEIKAQGILRQTDAGAERPDSGFSDTSTLRDF